MIRSMLLFVAALCLVFMLCGNTRAGAPGLCITGHVSATDTERAEQMIAIGQDVIFQLRDEAIYKRQVEPLVGHIVKFCLVEQ